MDTSYYRDLITSEYRLAPHFMAWLEAGLTAMNDAQPTAEELISAFDLDHAKGIQLDILGRILGRARTINFNPESGSAVLDDDTYRMMLRAKIVWNTWDGTITALYDLWGELFPDNQLIIADNQDMTMDVLFVGDFTDLESEIITNGYIIPKPEGVRINFYVIDVTVFSYGYQNKILQGYGAAWLDSKFFAGSAGKKEETNG